MSSNARALKTLLRNIGGLLNQVHQFNCDPVLYAHPAWLDPLVPLALREPLMKCQRSRTRLSAFLLQRHGLDQDFWYDFEDRRYRFVLLPPKVLQKLARYCGLAFQHRAIAAAVGKAAIAQIKTSIGASGYRFAMKRAPLILGQRNGIDVTWNGRGDFHAFVESYGAAYFLAHFKTAPRAISGRLAFKFDPAMAGCIEGLHTDDNGWPLFKRILIHEIDHQWQTLFS